MDMIVERAAALDAHKAQVTACVRVPNDGGERDERIAEFPTTVRGLLALRDWLTGYQVQQVVMEATGVYWRGAVGDPGGRVRVPAGRRPPRQAGPGPQDRRLRCRVAVPAGRAWAAKGELCAAQADPAAQEPHALSEDADPGTLPGGQRLHKALEDAGIKLDCVAADVMGKSAATCSMRWSPARPTPSCSRSSPGGRCARRSRRGGRRWPGTSTSTTGRGSARSSRGKQWGVETPATSDKLAPRRPELGPYLRGRRGPAAWPPVRRDPRLFCAGAPAASARHGRPRSGRLHAPCSRLGLLGAVSDSLLGLHRDAGPAQQGLYLAHQGHARARASEFDVLDPRADGLRWLDYYHDDQSATAPTVSAAPTAARRAWSVPLNPTTTVLGSWVAVETFIRRARQQAKAARPRDVDLWRNDTGGIWSVGLLEPIRHACEDDPRLEQQ